jgi:hypothetical protein
VETANSRKKNFLESSRGYLLIKVERWIQKKESIKRFEKRTPDHIKKTLLKISLIVNVKVRTRTLAFFTLGKKLMKQVQKKQENNAESTKSQHLGGSQVQPSRH